LDTTNHDFLHPEVDRITCVPVTREEELQGILSLQQRNLAMHLTPEEIRSQGFVTVIHTLDDLTGMNLIEPSVIAKSGHQVIGYVLAMTSKSIQDILILEPMFALFEKIMFNGQPIASYAYMVVGQVCIEKDFRGMGVLEAMYKTYRSCFQDRYDFAITEIATNNIRSIRAHQRIGFQGIYTYVAPDGEQWEIVLWNWRKK
jgi:hypothetical protein